MPVFTVLVPSTSHGLTTEPRTIPKTADPNQAPTRGSQPWAGRRSLRNATSMSSAAGAHTGEGDGLLLWFINVHDAAGARRPEVLE